MAAPFSVKLSPCEDESRIDRVMRVCLAGCSEGLRRVLEQWKKEDVQTLLNQKNKDGTTPLHEACRHGYMECIKLLRKYKACAMIWDDSRGFPPILCAVYNDHTEAVQLLVDSQACDVNCQSEQSETPLHLACLRGNMTLAQYLVSQDASPLQKDCHGNTALHYAAGSRDGSQLVQWLLGMSQVKDAINWQNQFGETAAHRAAFLGLAETITVLRHHQADFSIPDNDGLSACDLAETSSNGECYANATASELPQLPSPSPPPPPPFVKEVKGPLSRSSDAILQNPSPSSQPLTVPILARQKSSEDHTPIYARSSSPELLPRRPSMTGIHRPYNLSIPRRDSRTSLHRSLSARRSGDKASIYVTKAMAERISMNLERQESCGWEEAQQVVYDSTAYDPPPSIMFVHPKESAILSKGTQRYISAAHDIKLRIFNWTKSKEENVDVRIAAAMHLSRSIPPGYVVVSPICFVSCKRDRPCKIGLSLPHALDLSSPMAQDVTPSVVVLSTTTVNAQLKAESPLFGPGEQTLMPLHGVRALVDERSVVVKTELVHPSLFAVAVQRVEPIPLRCVMFVGYPVLDGKTWVAGFDLEVYIGMNLRTVSTAMTRVGMKYEEKFFTVSTDRLWVNASLTNPRSEWAIERRNSGELSYSQVALTQYVDLDSFSHRPAYPPHAMFFIEPRDAIGAVKCNVSVTDSRSDVLCRCLVVPYAPQREVTPDPESLSSSQTQLINGHLISEV